MYLVVGGSGFIGGSLVARLRADGHHVTVVTHRPDLAKQPGYRFGDIQSPETLPAALAGARVVIQSTQFPGYPIAKRARGWTYMAYDAIGTERLVAAAVAAGAERYVYVSGVGAGPATGRTYFDAIHRGELALKESGLPWATLRPAFCYGPADKGLNKFLALARVSRVVPIVGADAMHQPVLIDDVAEALSHLVAPGSPSGLFEIGGPARMTMREMIRLALKAVGIRATIVEVPKALARVGASTLERLPGELLSSDAIDFICEDFVADNRRILDELRVKLTSYEEGLAGYLGHGAVRRSAGASRRAGVEAAGTTSARVF